MSLFQGFLDFPQLGLVYAPYQEYPIYKVEHHIQ